MRIYVVCGLLAVAFVGCGQTEFDLQQSQSLDVSPVTPEQQQLAQEVQKFNEDLAKLSDRAKKLDLLFDFRSAAKVWGQVQQLVESEFGASSWQAKNAAIAYQSSLCNSQFDQIQLEELKKTQRYQELVAASFKSGDLESAIESCKSLIQIQSNLFGEESVAVAQTKIQLASFQGNLARVEPAIANFHAAIQTLKSNGYASHPELEMSHAGLAALYVKKSSMIPAVANQKEATRMAGEVWGRQSLNFATQANQLGAMFHQAGNVEVAFEILNTSKAIREKHLGTEHPAFAHSSLNLGVVMLDLKRLDLAEQNFVKAMEIFRREEGDTGPMTTKCKSQLATVYMLDKRPEFAEPLLREVVVALGANSNPQVDDLLKHHYRLSVALARQGKYGAARPLLEQLIENQTARYGVADGRTVSSMRAFALLLDRTNQNAHANAVKQQIDRVANATNSNDFSTSYR